MNEKPSQPNHLLWLAGLLVLAFALRAGYSLSLPDRLFFPDAGLFDEIAWNVASQGRYATSQGLTTERTPSYILFLAAAYKLAGHHYIVARLLQCLLGTALVVIVMALGRRLVLSSRCAWLAGVLTAAYPFFIYYDSHLISESFLTFCLAASLLFWLDWRAQPDSGARALLCGASFAVLSLAKTIFIPYFLLLGAVELVLTWRSNLPRSPVPWILTGSVFLLPILLWGMRNKEVSGHFLLDSHGGITSLQAIVFHEECRRGTFTLETFFAQDPIGQAAVAIPNEAEREAFYFAQTKRYIRTNPARYLRQSFTRFTDVWRFYPRQDLEYREGRGVVTAISLLTEPFFILVGMIGLWKARGKWREVYPVYLCIAWTTLVYTFTAGAMRYRLPLMPLMITFAAYAICGIKTRLAGDAST